MTPRRVDDREVKAWFGQAFELMSRRVWAWVLLIAAMWGSCWLIDLVAPTYFVRSFILMLVGGAWMLVAVSMAAWTDGRFKNVLLEGLRVGGATSLKIILACWIVVETLIGVIDLTIAGGLRYTTAPNPATSPAMSQLLWAATLPHVFAGVFITPLTMSGLGARESYLHCVTAVSKNQPHIWPTNALILTLSLLSPFTSISIIMMPYVGCLSYVAFRSVFLGIGTNAKEERRTADQQVTEGAT